MNEIMTNISVIRDWKRQPNYKLEIGAYALQMETLTDRAMSLG